MMYASRARALLISNDVAAQHEVNGASSSQRGGLPRPHGIHAGAAQHCMNRPVRAALQTHSTKG